MVCMAWKDPVCYQSPEPNTGRPGGCDSPWFWIAVAAVAALLISKRDGRDRMDQQS